MLPLRQTAQARRDLLDIWLDIAPENIDAADRVYERLEARVLVLQQYPELGAARPDIAEPARMLVEPPYLIFYRILPDAVQVVRVLHGARRIDSALYNEGLA